MTKDRHQVSDKKRRGFGLGPACLLILVFCLLSCTFAPPPPAYLPPRETIAPGQSATVGRGENLYAFAQQHHASMRDVIVLNNLRAPFVVRPGQQLVLPAQPGEAPSMPSAYGAGNGAPAYGARMQNNAAYGGAGEQTGEYNGGYMPPSSMAVTPPSSAAVSQESLPPVASTPSTPAGPSYGAPVTQYQNAPQSQPAGGPPSLSKWTTPAPEQGTIATTASPPQQMAAITPPPPAAPSSSAAAAPPFAMIWPVQGPILSGYGPKGQGLRNDGINIGAPRGSPVVAAANGVVVYAGDEMKGYGNLVLIRHKDGWVTAYAHLARMLVSKDSVVVQGDEIGTVGSTGNVSSPQLHFEVRRGDKPVDPSLLIKR